MQNARNEDVLKYIFLSGSCLCARLNRSRVLKKKPLRRKTSWPSQVLKLLRKVGLTLAKTSLTLNVCYCWFLKEVQISYFIVLWLWRTFLRSEKKLHSFHLWFDLIKVYLNLFVCLWSSPCDEWWFKNHMKPNFISFQNSKQFFTSARKLNISMDIDSSMHQSMIVAWIAREPCQL